MDIIMVLWRDNMNTDKKNVYDHIVSFSIYVGIYNIIVAL